MIWRALQYDFPQAAWLLLAVPALAWGFVSLYRYRQRKLTLLAHAHVLDKLLEKRSPAAYWVRAALCCVAWTCGVLALMQPKGNERAVAPAGEAAAGVPSLKNQVVRQKQHDVLFLIDASASMGAVDKGAGKDRLSLAKEIADEVISRLKGEDAALYAFTSATMQLVPATADYLFLRLMLRQIQINEGETAGTDTKQALEAIRKQYLLTPSSKLKTLVLLTDGGDTHIDSLQGRDREAAIDALIKVVDNPAGPHLRVMAVGIGSAEGAVIPGITYQGKPVVAKLDAPLLRKLAARTGGKAFFTEQLSTLQIGDAIAAAIAEETPVYSQRIVQQRADETMRYYDYYFQWPLGIGLAALMLALLLPETAQGASRMRAFSSWSRRRHP